MLPPHFSSSGSVLGPPSTVENGALGTGSAAFRVVLIVSSLEEVRLSREKNITLFSATCCLGGDLPR